MMMVEGSMQIASMSGDPTAKLTDDMLTEIISRVPYKSTCCCKCVSTRWRDLISHPFHRKKMPQSLIGFFHESSDESSNRELSDKSARCYTNVSGKGDPLVDPSLSFLAKLGLVSIVDCCNGLLLCFFCKQRDPVEWDYVVCNPATEKWVVVPGTKWTSNVVARLAFDPAASSHFYVCEFIEDSSGCIAVVVIYSSKTGHWSYKDDAWSVYEIEIPPLSKSVLFRGVMYLCAFDHRLVALVVEENNWKAMHLPMTECYSGFGDPSYDIYLSQGQLYFAHKGGSQLSIWFLEDPSSENWTFKHIVSHLQMLETQYLAYSAGYVVLSIHPEQNLIFLVCRYEETLRASPVAWALTVLRSAVSSQLSDVNGCTDAMSCMSSVLQLT
ncbi:F-box protein At5g62510-like [Lolium rigidum]|uniref:F-box protein At5g62510-like n=1 Tax=Lolium rigidum TaxID=89674 RepID=UPI001F5CAB27|nr:F-box protein At5g62510-like [Lolium rigidum]